MYPIRICRLALFLLPWAATMSAGASAAGAEISQTFLARAGFENRIRIEPQGGAGTQCRIQALDQGRRGRVAQLGDLTLSYLPDRGVGPGQTDRIGFRLIGGAGCGAGEVLVSTVGPLDCYGAPSRTPAGPSAPGRECPDGLVAPLVDNPLSLEPRVDHYGDPISWE